ncbi:hypothetical protein MVEN_02109300 [Mycena venus]|uniref:Uncharacterized protein n=1 Tax=Mycena venus TaxID=2733690 RepID=A0A8H6X9W3_9AGAR|nr:hypothetical protein MVEN_02109300 [Mycena venus]
MNSVQRVHLLALPPELLLRILGQLYKLHDFRKDPYQNPSGHFECTIFLGGLRSISTVNRQLRLLSLPLLFKRVRCTNLEKLQQLGAECTVNPQFAPLIRHLDVVEADSSDFLHELIPCLTSLAWLSLQATQLDAPLLVKVNSHPILSTVSVRGPLNAFSTLLSSTDLSFSKILISITIVSRHWLTMNPDTFLVLVQRGASFSHLISQDEAIFNKAGSDSVFLPDLEHLDLNNYDYWTSNDIPFAADFGASVNNVERIWGVKLQSFSIARPTESWSSLKGWEVVQMTLELDYAKNSAALKVAIFPVTLMNSPRPSALRPLCALHLSGGYGHLDVNGRSPWIHSQRTNMRTTRDMLGNSKCVTALHALQWYMTRVAQQATGLELIHVTDTGTEGTGRSGTPWSLQASFEVLANEERGLEMLGSPRLQMDRWYLSRN